MHPAADTRILITFTGTASAYLLEGENQAPQGAYSTRFTLPTTPHIAGCTCCSPQSPAAKALALLFRARATGAAPWFTTLAIRATPAGQAAIRAALAQDQMVAARYRE